MRVLEPVKNFRGSLENVLCLFKNTGERTVLLKPSHKKTGCRAFMPREFRSKCARASAARKPQPHLFMTNAQLKKLVTEAVALHRDIATQNERLKILKADLIHEARLHPKDSTPTNGGGSRWTASGTDGCIARVNFPAPSLLALIDSESETFDNILALAGECMDQLFESVYYLRPIANFREEAARALEGREADKLIDLCQTTSPPRVSFETADQKAK
jgi:hypothetical protein